jgi:hypothetical protein
VSCRGRLFCGDLFVVVGCLQPGGTVPTAGVVETLAPGDDSLAAWSRVVKWCRDSTSCSNVENNASAAALSKHDPTPPIDWRTPETLTQAGETWCGVSRSAIGVEYDALDHGAAAAHRGCDLDRVAREFGVWVRAGGAGARRDEPHSRAADLTRYSTLLPYISPSGSAISSMRAPSGSRK